MRCTLHLPYTYFAAIIVSAKKASFVVITCNTYLVYGVYHTQHVLRVQARNKDFDIPICNNVA